MKKLVISLLASAALATTLCLTACGEQKTIIDGNDAQSVYAFSAASAAMLVSENVAESAPAEETESQPADPAPVDPAPEQGGDTTGDNTAPEQGGDTTGDNTAPEQTPPAQTEDGTDELDGYMAIANAILTGDGFKVEEGASDLDGYESMTTISAPSLGGGATVYEMHFNKTLIPDFDDDWDDDEDEDEREYALEGIMIIDGAEYEVRGTREVESERGESESETKFCVYLERDSYILVEHSYETERGESEQEYSYTLVRDGQKVEESTIEIDRERDEYEVELTAKIGRHTYELTLESEIIRGKEVLTLRTRDGKDKNTYIVTPVENDDGSVDYTYTPIYQTGVIRTRP